MAISSVSPFPFYTRAKFWAKTRANKSLLNRPRGSSRHSAKNFLQHNLKTWGVFLALYTTPPLRINGGLLHEPEHAVRATVLASYTQASQDVLGLIGAPWFSASAHVFPYFYPH